MTSFDTVIVGGGPIGMAIASCLGQHGMAVALIEKNPEPDAYPSSQWYAMGSDTVEWLRANNSMVQGHTITSVHVTYHKGVDSVLFDGGHTRRLSTVVGSGCLRHALRQTLDAQPTVTIVQPRTVASWHRTDHAWMLTLDDGQCMTTPLVVGCDGRHSTVRSFFQPKTSTWDFGQKACVFMARGLDRGHAYEHFFPGGALALLAIDDGADAARLGKGVGIWIDRTQNVSSMDQRLAAMMHTVAPGSTPVDGTYRWFPVTGQWVHNPFFHRCVLVGDAACVIHPLAGQGLNIGLRMAQRLCDHVLLRRRTRCDWGQCLDSLFWPFYTIAGTMQMATYGMAHGLSLQSWDRAWTWGARLANAFPVVKDVILRASGKRS